MHEYMPSEILHAMLGCKYCVGYLKSDEVGICLSQHEHTGLECTREAGHSPPHVACSPDKHPLLVWGGKPRKNGEWE